LTRSRVTLALLVVVAADLLLVVVSGGASPLAAGQAVGPGGFGLRTLLVAGLLVARFRVLMPRERRLGTGALVLALLALPLLAQFQFSGGRINGDGLMYYVYVRSLMKDGDVDLANEYDHYGLLTRGDLSVPTRTGLRRSIFSIGPAVAWIPFFALGEGVARARSLVGAGVDLSGYGPDHRNAVALGSFLYGVAAVLLVHDLLRRHFRPGTALGAALLVVGTTFLPWYMVQQPTMSHALSAFSAALVLWLWDRRREGRTTAGYLVLGLALGLAMCIRWQNGVLLLLPGLELLGRAVRLLEARQGLRATVGALAAPAAALAVGTAVGAFPQMAVWKALYDMWVLPYPPHGRDFVRLDHPFVLETFFSSRHGLLSWTPVFWAGYLGFLPMLRRRTRLALYLLGPLVLMTYVNLCSGDWWAGGSFSNRRFDSLLPLLAFGFAASLDVARSAFRARPRAALALAVTPFVLWNGLLMEQVRRGLVPRDDTVAFPTLVGHGGRILADAVGSPNTWPASWVFAWRHRVSPGRYDRLVGRYLFYRQNNMGGRVELGAPGDDVLLAEGWGPAETVDGVPGRALRGRARLFAPLDVPEDLEVRFRAAAATGTEIRVLVNGREAGRFWAEPGWGEHRLRVPAAFWRRELNEVALDPGGPGVVIDGVDFRRLPA